MAGYRDIEKPRLIGDILWLGFIEGRTGCYKNLFLVDAIDRAVNGFLAVTEIRTKRQTSDLSAAPCWIFGG